MDNKLSISCLPDEVIFMVLRSNNIKEIVYFGLTCKRFNDLINSNQGFWREKFEKSLPEIYAVAKKHNNGLWLHELKGFMKQKQIIYREILKMSPKYYWKLGEFSMNDMGYFFTIASNHNLSYYYTIYILQELIKIGNKAISQFHGEKPFTLTEIHYAKVVLRYLKHCYMAVKWVRDQINLELPPENVVNFFLQWIDTDNFHYIEDVEETLQEIANIVYEYLVKTYPKFLKKSKTFTAFHVFSGVSHILFHEENLTTSPIANLDTINIKKTWNEKDGNQIVVFAMYQAIARRLGAHCELIVFANHLFLEWRNYENNQVYTVNVATGEVEPKRRCPFAQGNLNARYIYSADSLLHCLHSSYMKSMGNVKCWATINATDLLGFLGGNYCNSSPYGNFYQYLSRNSDLISLTSELDMKFLTEKELQIIFSLLRLYAMGPNAVGKKAMKILETKKHHSNVLLAVGMICCHKKNEYVCIVRGWDRTCAASWRTSFTAEELLHGFDQPFYQVLCADQSERYVPQENLVAYDEPMRIEHLEDLIAKEFSHFDGFSYVLNDEKKLEYPDEGLIAEVFQRRYRRVN